jgi:hypothetical protein
MKSGNNDKLLKEAYPSYMLIGKEDMDDIFESFKNIFKTAWSSIKLLSNTLALNLKVIKYTFRKDEANIKAAFNEFAVKRVTYDKEMTKNLKFFSQNYNDDKMLSGYGPGMLAFAANPLLFLSNRQANKRFNPEDEKEEKEIPLPKPQEKPKAAGTQKISDRVKAAMVFFGFSIKEGLSEAAQMPQAQPAESVSAPGQAEEQVKLANLAKEMLKTETEHAQSLLSTLAGRPAVIKQVVNAKNFDEMIVAAAAGEKIGMDLSSQAFRTAYNNIVATLNKEQKSDPNKFKKSIDDIRAKYPDIIEKDDIKAMTAFMFGTAKASIQADLIKSYNMIAEGAKAAMQLPIKDDIKAALNKTDTGLKYVSMLSEFERNIESGQQEMSALAAKKV